MIYVQFGGFNDCPEGWLNYEPSIYLRASRIPLFGSLIKNFLPHAFPKDVRIGNIIKGLPLTPGSVDVVFSSHVVEHLSREEAEMAFKNVYALLKPGGKFRLVLPDLYKRAEIYLQYYDEMSEPADWFMRSTHLGVDRVKQKGVMGILKGLFSTADHKWMWDFRTLSEVLVKSGFVGVRKASYDDHNDEILSRAEKQDRFFWMPSAWHGASASMSDLIFHELAIEASKPLG